MEYRQLGNSGISVSTARANGYQVPVSLQAQYNLATRQTE
jgi:hypothetical protein